MELACAPLLDALPKGSHVAVITMTGSCCPVTLAHIQCFVEARRILLGEVAHPGRMEHFEEVLGFLSLNSDGHVSSKLNEKRLPYICYEDRAKLVQLATEDLPWMNFNRTREHAVVKVLATHWLDLDIVRFTLNGADDVLKYEKWKGCSANQRSIAMGRPGLTERLCVEVRQAGIDTEKGWFILGPELPDISSTAVRKALGGGNMTALDGLLHPRVAQWCLSEGPYKPKPGTRMPSSKPFQGCESEHDPPANPQPRQRSVLARRSESRRLSQGRLPMRAAAPKCELGSNHAHPARLGRSTSLRVRRWWHKKRLTSKRSSRRASKGSSREVCNFPKTPGRHT